MQPKNPPSPGVSPPLPVHRTAVEESLRPPLGFPVGCPMFRRLKRGSVIPILPIASTPRSSRIPSCVAGRSPRIYAGEERSSAPKRNLAFVQRFGAGDRSRSHAESDHPTKGGHPERSRGTSPPPCRHEAAARGESPGNANRRPAQSAQITRGRSSPSRDTATMQAAFVCLLKKYSIFGNAAVNARPISSPLRSRAVRMKARTPCLSRACFSRGDI